MKILKSILLTGIMIVSVTACGGNDTATTLDEPDGLLKTDKIAEAVLKDVEFPSATLKDIGELNNYIDFDTEKINNMSYYICGSGAYPDELLILNLIDKSTAEDAKNAVQKRLDNQIETYKEYTPDEMYKLDGAKIIIKDNWVFFFATSDNDKVEEIINSFF